MKTGPALIAEIDACHVAKGQCAFWWLGQQSFVVKMGGAVCYLDPFLSAFEGRRVAPLLAPGDVTNATLILGSHDHGDHIDRAVWPALAQASPGARFVVPEILRERIVREVGLPTERVLGLDDGTSLAAGAVHVTGVPAAHEFLDLDAVTGLHPYLGFVVEGPNFRLYHAGDTCLYEGMQARLRAWRFDLAFLPINGRDAKRYAADCIGNMTYQEAADLAGTLRPGLTVPAHFEMFAMNSEDPALFADYMRVKYPDLRTAIPRHGECVMVERVVD